MRYIISSNVFLWVSLMIAFLFYVYNNYENLVRMSSTPLTSKYFKEVGSLNSGELETRMENRIRLVSEVCKENNKSLSDIYRKIFRKEKILQNILYSQTEYLVDRKHRIGWCKVPKAASASMVKTFFQLLNYSGSSWGKFGHSVLAKLMPTPRKGERIGNITNFIIVRHPFSRILSAFRDKFHNRTMKVQFQKFRMLYGEHIISKYRTEIQRDPIYKTMPTFKEFLDYVVDTPPSKMNEHWIPYYLSCVPCHIHYKSILHTETIEEDIKHLSTLINLPQFYLEFIHRNPVKAYELKYKNLKDPSSIHEVERLYYSTITKETLDKLYDIYRFDFELFGYSISPYNSFVNETVN